MSETINYPETLEDFKKEIIKKMNENENFDFHCENEEDLKSYLTNEDYDFQEAFDEKKSIQDISDEVVELINEIEGIEDENYDEEDLAEDEE